MREQPALVPQALEACTDFSISLSGGKDSTATYLHLLESGTLDEVERRGGRVMRVFADTGWELPATYAYVDELEARFGKIHRVATWVPGPGEERPGGYDHLEPMWTGARREAMDADRWVLARLLEVRFGRYSPLIRLMVQRGKLPSSVRRWCTDDIKKRPLVAFLATLDSPATVVGVRAEESPKRAKMPEAEWLDSWDAWVWRPLIRWTKADVIAIHNRHGIAPSPLYLLGEGAGRVGCAPCVNSGKDDLRWLARHFPERLALVEELERVLAEEMVTARVAAGAPPPRWFHALAPSADGTHMGQFPVPVQTAVEWANTARGGRQMLMFAGEGQQGCSEWGLCETGR